MTRRFRQIVKTKTPPEDHDVIWATDTELLYWGNDQWMPLHKVDFTPVEEKIQTIINNLDTANILLTDSIPLGGTKLGDLAKQDEVWGANNYVPEGTDLQTLLTKLLSKELYPSPPFTFTEGSVAVSGSGSFSIAGYASGSYVEVGTAITINPITINTAQVNTTPRTLSGFTYGYKDSIEGEAHKETSLSVQASDTKQVETSLYKIVLTTPDGNIKSISGLEPVTLSSSTFTIGSSKDYTFKTEYIFPKYQATFAKIYDKYILTNFGSLAKDANGEYVVSGHYSAVTQTSAEAKSSSSITLKARYKLLYYPKVSKSLTSIFPTSGTPEYYQFSTSIHEFYIPTAYFNEEKVLQLDTVSNKYVKVTDFTYNDITQNGVSYKRGTLKLGIQAGERTYKVTI